MNVLVVYAHPNPTSFNPAILEVVEHELNNNGHHARIRDLYATAFNPILDGKQLAGVAKGDLPEDVKKEHIDLLWAQGLIFIYPLWWLDRPAILKGWFDRVFVNGVAFEEIETGIRGLLHHGKALVLVTAGGTEKDYGNDPSILVKPVTEGTLVFCGIKNIVVKVFYGVPWASNEQRQMMLTEVVELINHF